MFYIIRVNIRFCISLCFAHNATSVSTSDSTSSLTSGIPLAFPRAQFLKPFKSQQCIHGRYCTMFHSSVRERFCIFAQRSWICRKPCRDFPRILAELSWTILDFELVIINFHGRSCRCRQRPWGFPERSRYFGQLPWGIYVRSRGSLAVSVGGLGASMEPPVARFASS